MEWKQIYTRRGQYSISEYGDVRNNNTNKTLKCHPNNKGYLRATLPDNRPLIHRLVAEYWIDNPNGLPQINHIDGNKLNNHYSNLERCNNAYNQKHAASRGLIKYKLGKDHHNAKLSIEQVRLIKSSLISADELSKEFGVKRITIYKIRQGRFWKHVT